jgi:glyoxylase-like metal-dependent hydrolase (beta-lactamase superfamily II)
MFKLPLILLTSLGLLAGCSQQLVNEPEQTSPQLYVLNGGEITVTDISMFSPGVDLGVKKTLNNSVYVIKHPKGVFVWDTGLNDDLIEQPGGVMVAGGAFHLKTSTTLVEQLQQINLTPEQVDYVGISHFHFDHTGNLNLFKNAKILLQQQELDAAFSVDAQKYYFDPASYAQISRDNFIPLNGQYDVFGDQSVVIYPARGHSPGHQVLLLALKQQGSIVLSGDLYHFASNRAHQRVPMVNFDKQQSRVAMQQIEKLISDKKAELWIQHDLEQDKTRKHAPDFYQ